MLLMQPRNTLQAMSEQLFEMTLCTNRGFVYYSLLEARSRTHQSLPQLCHVLHWRVIDLFVPPSLAECGNQRSIEVRAVGRTHVRSNEVTSLTPKQIHCLHAGLYVSY